MLGVAFWIVALAFVAVVVARRRALATAGWGDWALLGICAALFPVAIQSQRNMAPFLMFAAPTASRLLGPELPLPPAGTASHARPAPITRASTWRWPAGVAAPRRVRW